jgi:hypothetical protein
MSANLQRGSRPRCDLSADFDRLGVRKPYTALAVRYVGAREDWVQAMGIFAFYLSTVTRRPHLLRA